MRANSGLRIDREQVIRHLEALAPPNTRHVFLIKPDEPKRTGARHIVGSLAEVIEALECAQQHRCGVFLAVNRMQGPRRSKSAVTAVRAVWIERDRPGPALPLAPSLRIRSSPGRGHEYLLIDPADPLTTSEAERINRQIAVEYGGDRQACDLARVLRLAGTWHLKSEPHRVMIIGGTGGVYGRVELLSAFPEPIALPIAVPRVPPSGPSSADRTGRYVTGVIRGVVSNLARAIEGTRNAELNRAAFRLGQIGIGVEEAIALLAPTALSIGLGTRETTTTIKSGVSAGSKHPRLMQEQIERSPEWRSARSAEGGSG